MKNQKMRVYAAKNHLAAAVLCEPIEGDRGCEVRDFDRPLTFQFKLFDGFTGKVSKRKNAVSVACATAVEMEAVLNAIEEALAARALDDDRWYAPSEEEETRPQR